MTLEEVYDAIISGEMTLNEFRDWLAKHRTQAVE